MCAMPGNAKGFGIVSGRAFLGIHLETILTDTCLAPDVILEKVMLCSALDRATNSDLRDPVGYEEAVL